MALEAYSPYACTLFNYAQGKAEAAEDRMLLLCQGSVHHHLEHEQRRSDCFYAPLQTHWRGYCKWNDRSIYSNAFGL